MVIAFESNYINPDRNSIIGITNKTINEHIRRYGKTYTKKQVEKLNIAFWLML